MSVIMLLVVLIVIGLGLYVVGLLPLDPTIKKIIYALVLVVTAIWLLDVFVGLDSWTIGRVHHR